MNLTITNPDGTTTSFSDVESVAVMRTPLPPPPPAPAPEPPPPPPPPPPAPSPASAIVFEALNLSKLVEFEAFHSSARYERYRRLLVLDGATGLIKFQGFDLLTGGTLRPLSSGTYTLLVNDVPTVSVSVAAGVTMKGTFSLPLAGQPKGWLKLSIAGLGAGETCPTYWAFNKSGVATPVGEQPFTPVVRGTYEMAQAPDPHVLKWTKAPGVYNPTPRPITKARTYLTPSPTLPRSELHCEFLVPIRWGDMHRANTDKNGILSAFDAQAYFWSTAHARFPTIACLDGPRGVGTVTMATHLQLATAVVNGFPRETVYFSDSWRVGKVSEDGTVTTLVGWRHKNGMLSHWEDQAADMTKPNPGLELVGDWSAVPVKGIWETWGFAFDERTTVIDPNLPPVGGETPHPGDVVLFIADSQNKRILRVAFPGADRTLPGVVTEFLTGLNDPWDLVVEAGVIYVSERQANRIVAYDIDTKAQRVLVQGSTTLAHIDINRELAVTSTLAQRQAEPCCLPEGLFLQDGWLYFGSKAQEQIKRINLATNAIEVVRAVNVTGNSEFVKLALSDGTFGPRGSSFTWTWSNVYQGGPQMCDPSGVQMPTWWLGTGGTGDWTPHAGYGTAGCVSRGRMINANMVEGLYRITKSQAGDPVETAAVVRGRADYILRGLHLLHGFNGFGSWGLPLPFGVSSDIDAYLIFCGHTPTT